MTPVGMNRITSLIRSSNLTRQIDFPNAYTMTRPAHLHQQYMESHHKNSRQASFIRATRTVPEIEERLAGPAKSSSALLLLLLPSPVDGSATRFIAACSPLPATSPVTMPTFSSRHGLSSIKTTLTAKLSTTSKCLTPPSVLCWRF